jgi:flagellar biosynthesis/type III secretory pathway M-ring protein FliF/YscJ
MWENIVKTWNALDRRVKIVIVIVGALAIMSAIFGSPSPSVPVQ